ncbi:MAG TPA: hypothetical protein VK308_05370 [Pyrinomonadaceae bacterium]|nr:hypothetical protein [Pyrinomonadaceae bacterium]
MNQANLETVAHLAEQLPPEEQLSLVARIAEHLRQSQTPSPRKQPQSLRGSWRGKFPEDLDLDADLAEIRGEWLKELDEFGL